MNRLKTRIAHKRGVLKTEALLALFMLVATMSIASTMIHHINLLWSDAQRHQFAINELSNQMGELVSLSLKDATDKLASIEVSPACKDTLDDALLFGELSEDELGTRITLKLSWADRKNAKPVQLSGWLAKPKSAKPDQADQPDQSDGGEQ